MEVSLPIKVKHDSPDFKDRVYHSPFVDLPQISEPTNYHRELIGIGGYHVYDQDITPKCTGIATANAVNFLRIRQLWDGEEGSWNHAKRVSAEMLYRMGQSFDEFLDEAQNGSSLRGVIRSFKNNGVCPSDSGDGDNPEEEWILTIDRCKRAREVTLGAYERLQRSLIDYQTALREVGVVIVSARAHTGWQKPNEGIIDYDLSAENSFSNHAFVLIGYNERGFIVLNSMGSSWSTWCDSSGKPWEGVALWSYADWSANVLDAWVIRLGVPYANEVEALAGLFERETFLSFGTDQPQGVTRLMIQGHYLHTRDGQFVQQGVFASDQSTVDETVTLLGSSDQYKQLVIFVESGLLSAKAIAEKAAIVTSHIKKAHKSIFPLFILWREDVLELVVDLLDTYSRRIYQSTGGLPEATRIHLVKYAQNWLQPIWRTLEGEAERIFQAEMKSDQQATERGVGWKVMSLLMQAVVNRPNPMTIHFIVHGSGVLWLSALAKRIHQEQASLVSALGSGEARRATISSIDLLSPIASIQGLQLLASDLWDYPPVDSEPDSREPFRVYTIPSDQEKASRLGCFEGSFLELARCAFPIDGSSPGLRRSSWNKLAGCRECTNNELLSRPAWLRYKEVEAYIKGAPLPTYEDMLNDSRLIKLLLNNLR